MKKVLVFGTFDIFHEGHRNFLKQAKRHGDFLRVVVARNATVEKIKGKLPLHGEQERVSVIKASQLADEVVLGGLGDRYAVVRDFPPEVICLGYDQKQSIEDLQQKLAEFGLMETEIIRLEAYQPEIFKSSLLKKVV